MTNHPQRHILHLLLFLALLFITNSCKKQKERCWVIVIEQNGRTEYRGYHGTEDEVQVEASHLQDIAAALPLPTTISYQKAQSDMQCY